MNDITVPACTPVTYRVSAYGWPTRKAKRNRQRHYWLIVTRRAARGEIVKTKAGTHR